MLHYQWPTHLSPRGCNSSRYLQYFGAGDGFHGTELLPVRLWLHQRCSRRGTALYCSLTSGTRVNRRRRRLESCFQRTTPFTIAVDETSLLYTFDITGVAVYVKRGDFNVNPARNSCERNRSVSYAVGKGGSAQRTTS